MRRNYLAVAFGLIAVGCSVPRPEQFKEDKPLYEHALKLFNEKEYEEAIPFFESLRNRFPQSPYAIHSEMKIADARFEKADYAEAEVEYQSFRSLHPTHSKITHVVFRIGLCHYKQAPKTVDRDQVHTERAIELFQELIAKWPAAPEAKEAEPLLAKCRRALVERDLYVANFYLRHKQYEAALVRLRDLQTKTEFPELNAEIRYKLGYAYYKLKDKDQARKILRDVADDPKSGEFAGKAMELLK
ncbi:MAG TPA: outer membrane protein assembly factor BamD [Bdellovibrionota bacterium]|nr:outer membrane protein assembly factor BamD [Bdellovibrionota bacterium]